MFKRRRGKSPIVGLPLVSNHDVYILSLEINFLIITTHENPLLDNLKIYLNNETLIQRNTK